MKECQIRLMYKLTYVVANPVHFLFIKMVSWSFLASYRNRRKSWGKTDGKLTTTTKRLK